MESQSKTAGQTVAKWAYPATMAFGVALHAMMVGSGFNLKFSSYLPALCGAAIVTLLERYFPYRKEWQGKRDDVLNDSAYMLVVQIALPFILISYMAFSLLEVFSSWQITMTSLWPHELPTWLQALLMILAADFLRYWLHRFSHAWPLLWRLHAVHHSPHKVYWVNVARFHPIEKALQFLFDSLPFIFFGVSEEVFALYLVLYSINGFFQHCDVEVRLGFLNYIVSGPELHRWHHSKFPKESNQNYGNNLIVWDLLFGTWFLPPDREVGELGLPNREYPMSFAHQLKTPFIKGIERASDA